MILVASYIAHRSSSTPKQRPAPPRRLAILPFQNLQENPDIDFLGYSLADAIITKLGYVSELVVRPSYAVQKYKTQSFDIRKLAAELNVDTLLTGTFLREGDNLRIACQLIDVKSESLLWKGAFDLKYDKLLTVQDEVAQQILRGLELTLSAAEIERLKPDDAVNPVAYEYYLRGVDLYSKSDFPMAVKMLEKATELRRTTLSPGPIWASRTLRALRFNLAAENSIAKDQFAFEQALRLQPEEIEARIYMANMFTDCESGKVRSIVTRGTQDKSESS